MRELAPGTVLGGHRIESLVGRGGMGVVYRAVQLELGRVVALKVIAPELLDDDDVRARFLAEARAAASVDHPNVIPVYTAGEDDGIAYIAMRFVAGDDLRSLVRGGGALDPAEAAHLVGQAGAALDAIHRAGFVHRDVKPANLLVDEDRHVYLTDFGLAKAVLTQTGGTRTGHWVGTLDYVAPEQIRGGRIDARVDVYALGGVLHFALTAHVPFEREGDEAKLWAQLSAPPPVPSALRRGLAAQFDVAVARAMAKDPDSRYPSAGDLGRAARAAAAGTTPSEPERMVARGAAAPGASPTEPGLAAEASTNTARPVPRRRRRAPRLAAAGGLAAAALAAGVWLAQDDPSDQAAIGAATAAPTATRPPEPTPSASAARVADTTNDVGDRPNGLALANGDVWVTSQRQPRLTRVVAATGSERRRHPRVGVGATSIVVDGDHLWVALSDSQEVVRLKATSGAVVDRLRVPGPPNRLAVLGNDLWVATAERIGAPARLLSYDRVTRRPLSTLDVPEGITALVGGGGALWVAKGDTRTVARRDPDANLLETWVTLPAEVRSMHYGDGTLFVSLLNEDTVARVETRRRGDYATQAAGHSPGQLLLAGGRLYVASQNDNSVLVLDPETLEEVAKRLPVGVNPFAMTADERSIWVAGLGDDTLTRIDYR